MTASLALALALAASPSLRVAPAAARPGDAVLVAVDDPAGDLGRAPHGTLAGRRLTFWKDPSGGWRSLVALPLETAPGTVPVEVAVGGTTARADLAVVDPRFPSRSITLPEKFVEPPARVQGRIKADRAAFSHAYDRPFVPPLFDRVGWPRDAHVTGRFGDQRILNGRKPSVHYGLDLDGEAGAPVLAAGDGEVVMARDCYMSGKSVVLWHGAGVFTAYFHLSRIDVGSGWTVKRGDSIGLLGSTGRATGPHLHWSARVDGLLVDPESLLLIDFPTVSAPPRGPREQAPPAASAPEGVELLPPPPAPEPGTVSDPAPP
ncbi:MAG TPA: M23 family metallopeptidase [Anaeromyxobacteraceae bacterium]|nr:M23 family metallopeptidase [Anaeromyxobacteraceae bacterium]